MTHNHFTTQGSSLSKLKIPALAGRDARNNTTALKLIALRGSMNKYDLYNAFPGEKKKGRREEEKKKGRREEEKKKRKNEKNYPTVSRRVDNLVARGYLAVTGSKIVRGGTRRQEEVKVYGLTWRGLIAALAEEVVQADIVAVLARHEKSLGFPGRDIAIKVLERWPEEARHDTRLIWNSFLKVLPGDIEEIPEDKYASYLFPAIGVLDEQPILLQKIDQGFIQELFRDREIQKWAKRETVKIVQQLRKQLEAFETLAKFLGVKAE